SEYRHGALAGDEVHAERLATWDRSCASCRTHEGPGDVEPIGATACGGASRVSTPTLGCVPCTPAKGPWIAAEGGHPELHARANRPLRDAVAVNATRWALDRRLMATGLSVEMGTGGRTTWKRTRTGLPTAHGRDAVCGGASRSATLQLRWVVP